MADEDLSIAETLGQEATATEQGNETAEEPNDLDTNAGDELEGGEGDTGDEGEPELATVEVDGVEYQVPKALEGAFLKNADYTQKTQSLAARNKALDDRETGIEERSKATDEELEARGELKSIEKQLAEYAKLTPEDWQFHHNQDPMRTQEARWQFEALKERKAQIEGAITKSQNDRTEKAQQDLAKRVQETAAFAQKEIPGWKPELTDKLINFALAEGIPETVLKSNWSPTLLKLLHRAYLGDQALQKSLKPKPPTPKPLATVSAKSSPKPSGLDDRLSTDEWMRRRNAQLKASR